MHSCAEHTAAGDKSICCMRLIKKLFRTWQLAVKIISYYPIKSYTQPMKLRSSHRVFVLLHCRCKLYNINVAFLRNFFDEA